MNDDKRMKEIQLELALKKLGGSINTCLHCEKKGNFGSITRYECQNGEEYLICGWCDEISLVNPK